MWEKEIVFLFFKWVCFCIHVACTNAQRSQVYIERCASIIVESSRAINCICFVIIKRLHIATMVPFLAHERKMCRLERICHQVKKNKLASAYLPIIKDLKELFSIECYYSKAITCARAIIRHHWRLENIYILLLLLGSRTSVSEQFREIISWIGKGRLDNWIRKDRLYNLILLNKLLVEEVDVIWNWLLRAFHSCERSISFRFPPSTVNPRSTQNAHTSLKRAAGVTENI